MAPGGMSDRNRGGTWSRRVAVDVVGFVDVLGVIVGGFLPIAIYGHAGDIATPMLSAMQACLLASLFAYLCMRHFGLYDVTKLHNLPLDPLKIAGALLLAFLTILGLGLPFVSASPNFWVWYATWFLASTTWLLGARILARSILRRMTLNGVFDTRIAVYGSGRIAERLTAYFVDPRHAVQLAGVYDDRTVTSDRNRHAADAAKPVDGTLADLVRAGRDGRLDQIIIALPPAADVRTAEIARQLEQLPVSLHICTHLASDLLDDGAIHTVSNLGPVGLLDVKTKPLSDWGRHVKRVEDVVIAALALVILAPVIALVALAVKYDSPGPVLFRQRRHGLNRRVIEVLKFRSMTVAEDGATVTQAQKNDC
jgi:FlaA1/EpsC-like NDP-sugar epimerase